MSQSIACVYYHIVFSTKDRRPLITPALQPRLHDYLGGIMRADQGILHAIGGTADHVHVLTTIHKTRALATAIQTLKGRSSKWVHETFPEMKTFAWQVGYGAFSVSHKGLARVEAYLAHQPVHHQTQTFKDEFLAFLDEHGVEYDERYLWA